MGNRVNFGFRQSNGETIVLYGHWAGDQMLAKLAAAVDKARPRWEDESYATRICISQLIGEDWDSETGWGLHVNEIGDNEHKIPIINWSANLFSLHDIAPHRDLAMIQGVSTDPLFTMALDTFVVKYAPVSV
jgi:hypothetical protein